MIARTLLQRSVVRLDFVGPDILDETDHPRQRKW